MSSLDLDRTPVLVGIGVANQREDDFIKALEPIDLMIKAVEAAGVDTGITNVLSGAQWIAVPRGRWRYSNPAGEIARSLGAQNAISVLSSVGVLQQTLIGEACGRISRGLSHTTLVAGSDAGWRLLRAKITGEVVTERSEQGSPDVLMEPKEELRNPVEKRAGLIMPVGLYAMMESAFRYSQGWSIEEHRDRLAQLVSNMSRIASKNPDAWTRRFVEPQEIREAGPSNPMQAFPYNKLHCSSWNVDQAAALLFCSATKAQKLGIPRERWIFPLVSTESNHMVTFSAREHLYECVGAKLTGQAALAVAQLRPEEVDLVELYSCFPIAVQTYAQALGLPLDTPLTITGGMNFAGGPYNNYHLQSTVRAAQLLRSGHGRTALISCVSGILTKQAFGMWSTQPGDGFVHQDLSEEVKKYNRALPVLDVYTGEARVAAFTVIDTPEKALTGILLVNTPQGQRALITTKNPGVIKDLQLEEFVGKTIQVVNNEFLA